MLEGFRDDLVKLQGMNERQFYEKDSIDIKAGQSLNNEIEEYQSFVFNVMLPYLAQNHEEEYFAGLQATAYELSTAT